MKTKYPLNKIQIRLLKYLYLLVTLFFSFPLYSQAKKQEISDRKGIINENIEWTNSWVVATRKHDLPRVLVIGDSHVNAYYTVLADLLKDKAYVSKFTTSKCLGDRILDQQLKWFLKSYQFDIITFNNGLHGIDFTLDQYSKGLLAVYKLFKKHESSAKLIWVNTTARRIAGRTNELDSLNQQVIERNKAVSIFTNEKQIPLVDSYTISVGHPEFYQPDGIHFKPEGINAEVKGLANIILQILDLVK
jgi:lysophospholipase L1-like esterase